MPSNHLILCWPSLLLPSIFPSIRVFSNESALHIRWPKYWSFSFSISPSNEYSGLISFRIDWFDWLIKLGLISLLPKGLSRVFSNLPYGPTLTFIHDYWKDHSLDYMDLCQQSDVSVFNMLSRLVIAFLSKSKCFFNFTAAVTMHSDFGAQENIICYCFHFFPICHEVMGPDAMILVF